MRTMNILASFTLLLGINLGAPHAFAQGAEHSGGGGNRVLQFKNIAYELVTLLEGASNLPLEIKRINLKKLKKAIDQTQVEVTDQILRPSPKGKLQPAVIVDALNTPSRKLIRFNKEDWDLFPSGSKRTALVLHEYLAILDAQKVADSKDDQFQISHFIYDHPALRLWFDNSEAAQALEGIEFDFPITCSYQYKNQAPVQIGILGQHFAMGNVETHSQMAQITIAIDSKTKKKLSILIFDESDEFITKVLSRSASRIPSLRFLIGWTQNDFFLDSSPVFSQSMRLSPNFQFEAELETLQLKIECHRVRLSGVSKPKIW